MTVLRPALVLLVLFTLLTGLAYPLAVTGIAGALLPSQAGGSPVTRGGVVVGSSLVGQNFASPRYFHGRPSALSQPDPADATKTVDAPYDARNSGGSNLGPVTSKLLDRIKGDVEALRAEGVAGPVPGDLVTASGSGLDPDVSPGAALAQVPRVAAARNLAPERVRALVEGAVEGRLLGVIGEPRVNVLALNLALDAAAP